MRHLGSKLAMAVLMAGLLAPPASGFELFGIQFFGSRDGDDAAVIADPRNYTISFETSAEAGLEEALRSASTLWVDRDDPASGAAGLLATARGDYARITSALYNAGYYGGTVSIQVNGREAADLPPDTPLPDPITVAVR